MPAFAENLDEKRPVVGTVCSAGSEGESLPAAMEATGQSDEIEFEGHEHTVQLLEEGGAGAKLPAVFETDGTTTESRQQGKFLGLSAVAGNGTRRPWARGKDETSPAWPKCSQRSLPPHSLWIPPVLIAGIVQFDSEDLIFWRYVQTATRPW